MTAQFPKVATVYLVVLLLASFMAVFTFVVIVQASDTLFEYYDGTANDMRDMFSTNWNMQTFTTTSAYTITSVKLDLSRANAYTPANQNFTVGIRATDVNSKPTGQDLVNASVDRSVPVAEPSHGWLEVNFTGYSLAVATKYAIVIRDPSAEGDFNMTTWYLNTTANYGTWGTSADSGGTWTTRTDYAFLFKIYGLPGVAPEYDYVDGQTDVDSHADHGSHSSFAAQQATDWTNDSLVEANTNVTVVNDAENFVDASDSNIDSHTGHGTSSNFTAQQDALVAFNDTLTEANTGGGTSDVFSDGFEDGSFTKWTDGGTTTWGDGATFMATNSSPGSPWVTHSGSYMADMDANDDGSLTSDNINCASASAIGISFYYMVDDMDASAGDLVVYYYDGVSYDTIVDLGGAANEDVWYEYSAVTTDLQYFKSTFRLRLGGTPGIGEAAFCDDVVINVTTASNYELDYEFSWTTADFDEANEYVCLRTAAFSGENVGLDVWNGSWKSLSNALTASAWNNFSLTGNLTSATIYFRFIGKTESGDTTQSTWVIECSLIHTWSTGVNYELDLEEQFTSANFSRTSVELCVRMGAYNTTENVRLDYWNATGSAWVVAVATLTMNVWNNVSVKAYTSNVSVTFTVRFVGTNESGDTEQSSWDKDACLLHTWDAEAAAVSIADARLSSISDTSNITSITVNTWYDWEANLTHSSSLASVVNLTVRIADAPSLTIAADSPKYNESAEYWFRYLNSTDAWEWYSGSIWTSTSDWLDTANCSFPTKTETYGWYLFRAKVSRIARYSSSWQFAALAFDSSDNSATKTFSSISIAQYDEIIMVTTTHGWTNVNVGASNVLVDEGAITLNVTCNFNFDLQARSNSSVAVSGAYSIGIGNITIHKDTLGSAISLTTDYANIGGLTSLNTLAVDTQYSFKLWISIPSDTEPFLAYVYTCQIQTASA